MADRAAPGPRLLYVVTEDWFFASHFLPMARTAAQLGFEVVIATRVSSWRERLEAEGFRVVPLQVERRSALPLPMQVVRLAGVMRRERPALVHAIAVRSVVAGGLAARLAGIDRRVIAPTGLGHLWISDTRGARLGRGFVRRVVRSLRGPGTLFLFENHDDPADIGLDPAADRIAYVGGAGVDPEAFPFLPMPDGPLRLALVGRMLWTKGVAVAVEAVQLARAGGTEVTLELVGAPDPSNPDSIPEERLRVFAAEPGIAWTGVSGDIAGVWRRCHAALLPSVREGLPRALVEAMASGRPALTSDVPGCRELVRDGIDGFLAPPTAAGSFAAAIARLEGDRAALAAMGVAARQRFEAGFTTAAVTEAIAAIYRELVPELPPR